MRVPEAVDHYRVLLDEHQWLSGDGLYWMVIKSTGVETSLEETIRRLAPGSNPEVCVLDVREDPPDLMPIPVVFIREQGEVRSLIQMESSYMGHPEVLGRLARDAQVWSVSWGPRDGGEITYATDGRVVFQRQGFFHDPARLTGESADSPFA